MDRIQLAIALVLSTGLIFDIIWLLVGVQAASKPASVIMIELLFFSSANLGLLEWRHGKTRVAVLLLAIAALLVVMLGVVAVINSTHLH
jgi:ascorbate-specific PTS system EIIC-type component UlaA